MPEGGGRGAPKSRIGFFVRSFHGPSKVSAPRTGRDAHGAHSHQPLSGPERRLAPVMWSMTRGHALGG